MKIEGKYRMTIEAVLAKFLFFCYGQIPLSIDSLKKNFFTLFVLVENKDLSMKLKTTNVISGDSISPLDVNPLAGYFPRSCQPILLSKNKGIMFNSFLFTLPESDEIKGIHTFSVFEIKGENFKIYPPSPPSFSRVSSSFDQSIVRVSENKALFVTGQSDYGVGTATLYAKTVSILEDNSISFGAETAIDSISADSMENSVGAWSLYRIKSPSNNFATFVFTRYISGGGSADRIAKVLAINIEISGETIVSSSPIEIYSAVSSIGIRKIDVFPFSDNETIIVREEASGTAVEGCSLEIKVFFSILSTNESLVAESEVFSYYLKEDNFIAVQTRIQTQEIKGKSDYIIGVYSGFSEEECSIIPSTGLVRFGLTRIVLFKKNGSTFDVKDIVSIPNRTSLLDEDSYFLNTTRNDYFGINLGSYTIPGNPDRLINPFFYTIKINDNETLTCSETTEIENHETILEIIRRGFENISRI